MYKILIIDDHPLMIQGIRDLIGSILPTTTFTSTTCIKEGISFIKNAIYDIITLDINLDGDDSIQYLPQIKKLAPHTPVLIYSSYATPSVVRKAMGLGASGYLLKTDSIDEVENALRKVLNGEAYVSQELREKPRDTPPTRVAKHTITSEFVQRYQFSKREMELLPYLAKGMDNKSIADQLFLSHHTIHEHRKRIYKKLDIHSKTELMKLFE